MKLSIQKYVVLCVFLILGTSTLSNAGWVIKDKLTAFPALAREKFGCSVATDGNWLAVGATDTAIVGYRSTGAVHLFERVGEQWLLRQTLFHPTPTAFQAFGCSVALRQDHLVVGSWGCNSYAGQAFVYTRASDGRWGTTPDLILQASDPQPSKPALFGWSVSLDIGAVGSGVIAVGRVNDSSLSTGAVYVFEGRGTTWTQVAKLVATDAARSDQLGTNVSVRNGTIVTGVPRRRAAYIFTRSLSGLNLETPVWTQTAKLTPSFTTTGDNFGYSVASAGNFVAVGSPNRIGPTGENRAGAVTVFYGGGTLWQEGATLTSRTHVANDLFGYAVGIAPIANSSSGILVASAPSCDTSNINSGAAFAFRGSANSWTMDKSDLWTSVALINQNIGKSLGISADGSVATLSTDGPTGSVGGAFPFQFNLSSSTGNGMIPGGTSTDGSSSDGSSSGGSSSDGSSSGGSSSDGSSSDGSSSGDDTTGEPSEDPSSSDFGKGGKVRSLNSLAPLYNSYGEVTNTVIVNDSVSNMVYGMQIAYGNGLESDIQASLVMLTTYDPIHFRLVAVADCNGDGGSDLVWQDPSTNEVILWTRNGTTFPKKETVVSAADAAGFTAVAAYDIEADGSPADILLVNAATKTLRIVIMGDGIPSGSPIDLVMPSGAWRPVPFAFIPNSALIQNPSTGALLLLTTPAAKVPSQTIALASPHSDYEIQAIGDLDGDGSNDIVTHSQSESAVRFYMMNGTSLLQVCTGICSGHWNVQGMYDWDGSGVNDLLISENGGRRRVVVLYMEVKSYANKTISIPEIKSNQVLGRLSIGGIAGLGAR
ncbi:MAG: hypothetical protein EXS12_00525 [Phycisphaerales bacterium]|nr:hypothetical protein [Phycisphaerales bacterium]